jgi:hypothetical protein
MVRLAISLSISPLLPIHNVFREIRPDDARVYNFTHIQGDCLMASFAADDVIPFSVYPLYHNSKSTFYFEGLTFDHNGRSFPWAEN